MTYTFDEVDVTSMSDEELSSILENVNRVDREIQERRIDLTSDEFRMFANQPGTVKKNFLIRNAPGTIVGTVETRYAEDGSNPDVLKFQIRVWPEYRRRGAGTAVLGHVATVAKELNREKIKSMYFDTIPAGAAFAHAAGGQDKLQFHENVVRVEDLDVGLLQGWVEQGPSRAPGYSVEVREGEYPEELLDQIAYLHYVLERDMPMSEGHEPRAWTVDLVRQMQEHYRKGIDALWSMAFHDETNRAVGMSELIRRHSDPTTWIVTVTMVDPKHRGKSIGKWLKGAVNLAALDRWPGSVYQETGNAFTNDAMLAINHAMGFRHEITITEVEFSVDEVLAYVAARAQVGGIPGTSSRGC